MFRRVAYAVVLSIILVSCGGTTSEVTVDVSLDSLESGTFSSSGDLFDCDGRLETIELHLNEGSTWWIEDLLTCSDGSGSLTRRRGTAFRRRGCRHVDRGRRNRRLRGIHRRWLL